MNAKWEHVKKACLKKGLQIRKRNSEVLVVGLGVNGHTQSVIIGHKCCKGPNADVWGDYLNALKRTFGFRMSDFRKKK